MTTLFWMQAGACSGDSMALLSAESPDLVELLEIYGIELLFHPSLSRLSSKRLAALVDDLTAGRRELGVLVVEGALATGPEGTGGFDMFFDRPRKDVVRELADRAAIVMAAGTCASYGGIPAAPPNPTDCTGLQFLKTEPGGLLDEEWRSRAGLPVINVPGCPAHTHNIVQTLLLALSGDPVELDSVQRPKALYQTLIHQGCTRNECHEYDVEETTFGGSGCLFFNLGCQGPYTMGSCNTVLWNRRSSKPRAGLPCMGCTAPRFPRSGNLFATEKLGTVPVELPLGVNRASYMAYKGLARAACPRRLLTLQAGRPGGNGGSGKDRP